MNRLLYLFIFISFFTLQSHAQKIATIELQDEKNALFRKVAWLTDNKFCVISDRVTETGFPHIITVYDTSGKVIGSTDKVKTGQSCQHEYIFSLGTTLYFLDYISDSYGIHQFTIRHVKDAESPLQTFKSELIFKIKNTKEKEKLFSERYTFKVYKGENSRKALLCYNNDYKEGYKEGFKYRMIDDKGNLSEEKNLDLPYEDRLCNIASVIYDDVSEKVIVACDLFKADGKQRIFEKSFIGVFDLTNGLYNEVGNVIAFNKSAIQYSFNRNTIVYSLLKVDDEKRNEWISSVLVFNVDSLKVESLFSQPIPENLVTGFVGSKGKVESELIHPVGVFDLTTQQYKTGWNYFFNIDQLNEAQKVKPGASVAAAAASAFTSLITGGVTVIMLSRKVNFTVFQKSLWLDADFNKNELHGRIVENKMRDGSYAEQSVESYYADGKVFNMLNFPFSEKSDKTNTCVIDNNFAESVACNQMQTKKFYDTHVNIIYPGSGFVQSGKKYLLGAYDPDSDNGLLYAQDFKLFLVVIE